jgi:hypothetical protein
LQLALHVSLLLGYSLATLPIGLCFLIFAVSLLCLSLALLLLVLLLALLFGMLLALFLSTHHLCQ